MSSALILGVDESGKGDFFGPLVVAALACAPDEERLLLDAGIKDGKQLSLKRLLHLDGWLRENYPFALVVVAPQDYNRRYQEIKNLNRLLAECHAEAISKLVGQEDIKLAVSDKFGKTELVEEALTAIGCEVQLEQIVRGEQVIQVAAASIIARAEFVTQVRSLETEFGVQIPRGASAQVDAAGREIVRRLGADCLPQLAKMHFKNLSRVTRPSLFT